MIENSLGMQMLFTPDHLIKLNSGEIVKAGDHPQKQDVEKLDMVVDLVSSSGRFIDVGDLCIKTTKHEDRSKSLWNIFQLFYIFDLSE